MQRQMISESEWRVMDELWDRSPRTASELSAALRGETGWADNTVRTLLTRLEGKGAVAVERNGSGVKEFGPAVGREEVVRAESESFLRRVFKGSASPLLAHFAENARLSPAEVRELKALLDRSLKTNQTEGHEGKSVI